jgi:hypothetical protein
VRNVLLLIIAQDVFSIILLATEFAINVELIVVGVLLLFNAIIAMVQIEIQTILVIVWMNMSKKMIILNIVVHKIAKPALKEIANSVKYNFTCIIKNVSPALPTVLCALQPPYVRIVLEVIEIIIMPVYASHIFTKILPTEITVLNVTINVLNVGTALLNVLVVLRQTEIYLIIAYVKMDFMKTAHPLYVNPATTNVEIAQKLRQTAILAQIMHQEIFQINANVMKGISKVQANNLSVLPVTTNVFRVKILLLTV